MTAWVVRLDSLVSYVKLPRLAGQLRTAAILARLRVVWLLIYYGKADEQKLYWVTFFREVVFCITDGEGWFILAMAKRKDEFLLAHVGRLSVITHVMAFNFRKILLLLSSPSIKNNASPTAS